MNSYIVFYVNVCNIVSVDFTNNLAQETITTKSQKKEKVGNDGETFVTCVRNFDRVLQEDLNKTSKSKTGEAISSWGLHLMTPF